MSRKRVQILKSTRASQHTLRYSTLSVLFWLGRFETIHADLKSPLRNDLCHYQLVSQLVYLFRPTGSADGREGSKFSSSYLVNDSSPRAGSRERSHLKEGKIFVLE